MIVIYPIGSMYGIYANIGGILKVNVTIYSIHGSYGYCNCISRRSNEFPIIRSSHHPKTQRKLYGSSTGSPAWQVQENMTWFVTAIIHLIHLKQLIVSHEISMKYPQGPYDISICRCGFPVYSFMYPQFFKFGYSIHFA